MKVKTMYNGTEGSDAQYTERGLGGRFLYPEERQIKESVLGRDSFQPKERQRRTTLEQIDFNTERLCVLGKQIDELIQKLSPVIVGSTCQQDVSEKESGEMNSEMMRRLLDQSKLINKLITTIGYIQRDVQL
jgi:hypothetical protein